MVGSTRGEKKIDSNFEIIKKNQSTLLGKKFFKVKSNLPKKYKKKRKKTDYKKQTNVPKSIELEIKFLIVFVGSIFKVEEKREKEKA